MLKKICLAVAGFLLFPWMAGTQEILPKPQIASAVGKFAPSFVLKDEHGQNFRLASMRGKRVLLMFYRGYW